MKIGIVGYGYWGKIIESKLNVKPIINPNSYDDIDFLFVTTPPPQHYRIVKSALLKKTNVFCEKPLTLNYSSSKELIQLSYQQNVALYIDNIFLERNEIKNINSVPKQTIEFIWLKNGPFKDNLINDLLYHDLYILIHLLGDCDISDIKILNKTKNSLSLIFKYGNVDVHVFYDRNWSGPKCKKIKIDDDILLELSTPCNDALKDSIDMFLNNQFNLKQNHKITLLASKLFEFFL
jgi:predicted dehydrogenase